VIHPAAVQLPETAGLVHSGGGKPATLARFRSIFGVLGLVLNRQVSAQAKLFKKLSCQGLYGLVCVSCGISNVKNEYCESVKL
jgi:hypothetical protein